MTSMRKTACVLAVLAMSSTSVWANSVDLRVAGTILPSSCTPNISQGGIVKYGDFFASSLDTDNYNDLGTKTVNFSLACMSPTQVGIRAVSSRLGTVVSDEAEGSDGFAVAPLNLFGLSGVSAAGLGLNDANKIGGYAARIVPTSSQADSIAVDTIVSNNDGGSWVTTTTSNITSNQQILSWAQTGDTTPIALTALAAQLEIHAYLNKANELDLSKLVTLDGLTTIEVVYL